MTDPEDFYRDFLPRFIEAQRAFHDGDPELNLALWSTEDPVTLFAARGLIDSGTEPVTATFRFVASAFSDVATFDWETLASGVAGTSPAPRLSSATPIPGTVALPSRPSCGRLMSIAAREGAGGRCTDMPTADLRAHNLTGDTISPTGLTASAGPRIGSARTRHRTCA